ncbi:Peptidase M15A [Leptothrix cholodnii SP-6]|uniref:Peptidase M15A n=1 Tax=Leptothrix cholodnii (strain ATCC 51168 / LMG 8142 / SP-6) TaxID=395495 RepID=B1Y3J8_LEPCP|nr:D-Ala-D-Ala carboxypeptidase family metallohydrolase [Leptothrix cholodnii]ACB34526.1 Peptidase M15A [Leptothrix cholodnii SP-6]
MPESPPPDIQLAPHFRLSELVISPSGERAGLRNEPQATQVRNLRRTAQWLETLRGALGCPITVLSGYRSPAVNKLVGGSNQSAHLRGLAADFIAPAFGSPRAVCERVLSLGLSFDKLMFDQLIYEGSWVHVGLAEVGAPMRNQVLTAVFAKGVPTQYRAGLV